MDTRSSRACWPGKGGELHQECIGAQTLFVPGSALATCVQCGQSPGTAASQPYVGLKNKQTNKLQKRKEEKEEKGEKEGKGRKEAKKRMEKF